MGISRLESIIRNSVNYKDGVNRGVYNVNLRDLPLVPNSRRCPKIRTVVIDTSEFIYKSIIGGDHTSGLLNFLEKMFRCQLMPIFVFDGKPPKEKTKVIEERRRVKERARVKAVSLKEKLDHADELLNIVESRLISNQIYQNTDIDDKAVNISDDEKYIEDDNINYEKIYEILNDEPSTSRDTKNIGINIDIYASNIDKGIINEDIIDKLRHKISDMINESERVVKKMVGINENQYRDIKNLFNHFNIPFIHAGVEAEMICAALVKLGVADYCIGNDMDLFALGCPRIIRNINFKDDLVDVYYLDIILDNLCLSYTEFVDLCIALGSDYTGRIGGVKNYHILEFIRKYRSIENMLSNIDNINAGLAGCLTEDGQQRTIRIPESFNFVEARNIFMTQFTLSQINEITSCPLNEIYECCANRCLELRANFSIIEDISNYCQSKCDKLNNMLITKKINTIIWSNLFQDDKIEGFTLVKNKKTNPISVNERRTDIINDIQLRRRSNFSRVAFGSSPNHALVMNI